MPLCQVNIAGAALANPATIEADLRTALSQTAPGAPIIVLIHGYKFSPSRFETSPHTHILSMEPRDCWKAVSWPRKLGLGEDTGPEPLCIGLGWEARGTLWQAYLKARGAGRALAELTALIQRLRPTAQVDVLAHSLGGRVALAALPHAEVGAIRRMVLLAPAELRSRAALFLNSPAGRAVEIFNITSRENLVFDCLLEWLVAPHQLGDRALGRGAPLPSERWLDLRIDDDASRLALAALGYPIPRADRRVCHWSVYLRGGLFPLYRAIIDGRLTSDRLGAVLPNCGTTVQRRRARWWSLPLPFARREAS